MEYDFWTMQESPFHQLSDFQCIFLFAFGEVKIIWLFGNSRGRHSTDILSEFRISGQVKMYALK